jgi:O-antigen/teichoic acid export membrane protein
MREQLNATVTLVSPFVVVTVAFAPLLIHAFYSREFLGAVPSIQWMGLGNAFKAVSAPLGVIVLAQGRARLFFFLQAIWFVVFYGLTWVALDTIGLEAVGVAFAIASIAQFAIVLMVSRRLTNFSFDRNSLRFLVINGTLIFGIFIVSRLQVGFVTPAGLLATLLVSVFAYRKLTEMLGSSPFAMARARLRKK